MPLELRKLVKRLKERGYSVVMTSQGHYQVLDKQQVVVVGFAATHGGNTKRDIVLDSYLRKIRTATGIE